VRRDIVERQTKVGREHGHVPQHVAEFVSQRLDRRSGKIAALIAQHLLDLATDLARGWLPGATSVVAPERRALASPSAE
jgi:hypothetical protein